jgi:signal recognition particle receptor subunit beta
MDSAESSQAPSHHGVAPTAIKLLIVGGRSAGKTTFVQTAASCAVTASRDAGDHPTGTAAIDIGRIPLGPGLLLYLLGLPDH